MSINTIRCNNDAETSNALKSNPGARVLGGGTLLMRSVNEGDQSFDTLVRNQDPGRGQIRVEGEQLVMGAGVTMAQLLISRDAAFLHEPARLVGGPAIRNMATVAGNLFAQCPYGDLATALLALDGEVLLSGESQRLSLAQFFESRDSAPRSLVVEIRCQRPARPSDFRFHKVSRVKPKGISVLAIATLLPGAGSGRMSDVRVAFGAMARTPLRSASVERSLEGQTLDEASIMAACQLATDGLDPPTDAIASSWYRQSVAPVHLGRVLRAHLGQQY